MSDSVETNATPQAKRMIGNFELIEKIGQGGMGTVHRARQVSLDRIVALKILPPSIAKDAVFIERFQKEARASAKLSHPNIVTGIDVGQDAKTGLWYFAMEYVDGPTLKEVLQSRTKIPEEEALKILREVASALDCLHQHGMVHRDIKPDNIIMTKRGEAKLADLGLAKDLKDDASLTQAGKAVGTPHYMAPEQVRGEIAELDIRADIYALGGTLFNLVTGKTPYSGETSAVIMSKHLTDPVPKARDVNPEVSVGLSSLIERMTQKKKEDRVQTPKELLELIEKVKEGDFATGPRSPIRATGPRSAVRTTGPRAPVGETRNGRKPMLAIAAVVAVVLIGGIAYVATSGKADAPGTADTGGKKADLKTAVNPPANTDTAEAKKNPDAQKADETAKAEETAKKEKALAKLNAEFSEAQLFEKEHPTDFAEALKKYRKLGKRAEDTGADALSDQIDEAVAAVQKRRGELADAEWAKIDGGIKEHLGSNNYNLALKACDALPPALAEMLKDKAEARARELHAEAELKIRAVVVKAEEFSATLQPEEAVKALAAADQIQYEPTTKTLADLKKRFEAEIANAVELKKKREIQAIEKAYESALASFDKAVFEDKSVEAAQQVAADAQKNPVLKNEQARLKALTDVAAALDDPLEFEKKSLENLKGQMVDLQRTTGASVKGTVKRVENGVLYVTMKMGTAEADFPVKLMDLSEVSRAKLTPPFTANTDAQRVAMAIDRLKKDDAAKAEEWLNAAPENPIAQHLRERVTKKKTSDQRNASETAAAALFGEINLRASATKISDADAKILTEKIARFEQEFSGTQFGKTVADRIAAYKKKIGIGVAAPVAVIGNGDFEKALLDPWEKGAGPLEVSVLPTAARTGRGGVQFSGDGRGDLVQRVMLEEGATYLLSGWVRVVKGNPINFRKTLSVRASDGENGTYRTPNIPAVLGEWKQLQTTFTATASVEARLQVFASYHTEEKASAEARRGIIQFDDIVLMKVSGAGAGGADQRRVDMPPIDIPPLLKLAGLSFWVSPKSCPQGSNREFLGNTAPVDAGNPKMGAVDGVPAMSFEHSSLTYGLPERMKSSVSPSGTMVAWVKPRTVSEAAAIFGRCDKRFSDIALFIQDGKMVVGVDYDSQSGATSAKFVAISKTSIPADRWAMVAVAWDARGYTLYINGEKDSNVPSAIAPPRRAMSMILGSNPPGSPEPLNGSIGSVMNFDRNLSDGEIKGLHGLSGMPQK